MSKSININISAKVCGDYDIIVLGGGVAGVAAAVNASRLGKKTLLIEKTIALGGLATIGLINFFVPMCNGRGVKIIKGMAEELFDLSVKYGYDTIPEEWKCGEPGRGKTDVRCVTKFSPAVFSLALTELVKSEGVDILFDSVVTRGVTEGNVVKGIVVENKSGSEYYTAKLFIDTTGDCDLLYRIGVPTNSRGNYNTFITLASKLDDIQRVCDNRDFRFLLSYHAGGSANLYGGGHPEGKPLWSGTDSTNVTEYLIENQIEALRKLKDGNRKEKDILILPSMVQMRTTRCIAGDDVFLSENAYKHYDDSICTICDFDRRDYLYEVSYKTLVNSAYPNVITAGRSASASGYGWDVIRVIPPAILTGQAAGAASALAIDGKTDISKINIRQLQGILAEQNVMIHFDNSLIPEKEADDLKEDIGHF